MLIVDDDPDIRILLRRYLEGLSDFDVVGEASNGVDAIQLVGQLKPSGVILDDEMPIMRGRNAIHSMRRIAPDMEIVMHSATVNLANSLVRQRADHYIQKGGRMVDFVRRSRAIMTDGR